MSIKSSAKSNTRFLKGLTVTMSQSSASILGKQLGINSYLKGGEVALVGAGPGDPELLTIRALRFIQQAEIAIYDRLVSKEILALLPENCETFYVGKEQAKHCVPQNQINALLVNYALQGKKVVRLKGGDPFIFGRGGEEAEYMLEHGVSCHVCPGITAASGCTSYSGIPLTHRGVAHGCTFITGHIQNDGQLNLPWDSLTNKHQTVVFYMGINTLPRITSELIKHGRSENTPAALIRNGTQADQETYRGTVGTLAQLVEQHNITPPTLIVIGDVVNQLTENNTITRGFFDAKDFQPHASTMTKIA